MVDILWDDAAFKKRVQALAKAKGLSMQAALEQAGITPRYFSRAQEGRSTNLILNLARALGVPPSELFVSRSGEKSCCRLMGRSSNGSPWRRG